MKKQQHTLKQTDRISIRLFLQYFFLYFWCLFVVDISEIHRALFTQFQKEEIKNCFEVLTLKKTHIETEKERAEAHNHTHNGLWTDFITYFVYHLGCELFHPMRIYRGHGTLIPKQTESQ